MPIVWRPVSFGLVSTGGCTRVVLSGVNADKSVSSKRRNPVGGVLYGRLFSGAIILTKSGANRRYTMHTSGSNLCFVGDVVH